MYKFVTNQKQISLIVFVSEQERPKFQLLLKQEVDNFMGQSTSFGS